MTKSSSITTFAKLITRALQVQRAMLEKAQSNEQVAALTTRVQELTAELNEFRDAAAPAIKTLNKNMKPLVEKSKASAATAKDRLFDDVLPAAATALGTASAVAQTLRESAQVAAKAAHDSAPVASDSVIDKAVDKASSAASKFIDSAPAAAKAAVAKAAAAAPEVAAKLADLAPAAGAKLAEAAPEKIEFAKSAAKVIADAIQSAAKQAAPAAEPEPVKRGSGAGWWVLAGVGSAAVIGVGVAIFRAITLADDHWIGIEDEYPEEAEDGSPAAK